MVRAFHVIFSCYGFWLPNDPRGSWSTSVRSDELRRFGFATKTNERQSLANRPHSPSARRQAGTALRYPPVVLTGVQARAVGRGFAVAVKEARYLVHACSVLPDHVHLVVARHERRIEKIVQHLKARATQRLNAEGVHPMAPHAMHGRLPTPWAHGTGWTVFLRTNADIRRSIDYVERNPERSGLPRQTWSFVTPYPA